MFNKQLLSAIIKKIKDEYSSQEEFSKQAEISRTYLSQYMNMRLEEPPKPNTLLKLAEASKGITTFRELLEVCGYDFDATLINEYENAQHIIDVNNALLHVSSFFDAADAKIEEINEIRTALLKPKTSNETFEKFYDLVLNFPPEKKDFFIKAIDEAIKYISNAQEERKTYHNIMNFKNKSNSNTFPSPNNQLYMCPVYGHIAAGVPNWAEQCIEGRLPLDPGMMNIHNPEECFFLRVSGESMNKVVKNGGYALIRKQEEVENGEIAVVLVNGYDATLKKFTRKNDMVILEPMSNDSSYEIQIYDHNTQIKILGKYIGKFEMN